MKTLSNLTKQPTMAFNVMEALKDYIIENDLKEGDSLPSQEKISEKLGVSRTIVREAIRALEGIGLLESRHGGGVFIKGFTPESLADGFAFGLKNLDYQKRVKYLFEVRECFEYGTIDLILNNIKETDHQNIQETLDEMESLVENQDISLEEFHHLDYEFHQLLLKATHNPLIIRFNSILRQLFKFLMEKNIKISRSEYKKIIRQHNDLYQTFLSEDTNIIAEKIKEHIKIAKNRWL